MRLEGIIKSWNDERGFGFIEPTQGGQEVFVHIKAFQGLRERPKVNQRVSFQVEFGPQGKKRALNVELVRVRRTAPAHSRKEGSAQWGTASLFVIPLFAVVLLLGYVLGHPPRWLLWAYFAASATTFLAYAFDKSAAKRGAWRTSEQTLHLLALIGGWPGALIAQQTLRHKSSKSEFRSVFWGTVALNIACFSFLASPYGQSLSSL
ncbi:DUF1294 domain-containing protein [bacterium]|nr:MAG: DUF1294 domain-containing protein [bacterium]